MDYTWIHVTEERHLLKFQTTPAVYSASTNESETGKVAQKLSRQSGDHVVMQSMWPKAQGMLPCEHISLQGTLTRVSV